MSDKNTFKIIEGSSQGNSMIGSFDFNNETDPYLPWSLWIKIPVKMTSENQISESEAQSLDKFEDDLDEYFVDIPHRFVGRLTFNGFREIYYYVNNPEIVNEKLKVRLNNPAMRDHTYEIKHDPQWEILKSYTKTT